MADSQEAPRRERSGATAADAGPWVSRELAGRPARMRSRLSAAAELPACLGNPGGTGEDGRDFQPQGGMS